MKMTKPDAFVANNSSLRFFGKELDHVACISEFLAACIVIRDSCIDAVSYETGALVCRIVPELSSCGSNICQQYSHFHLSQGPNCFWLFAIRDHRCSRFSLSVWDLTTASLFKELSFVTTNELPTIVKPVFFEFREERFEVVFASVTAFTVYRSTKIDLQSIESSLVHFEETMTKAEEFDLKCQFFCKKLSGHEYFGLYDNSLIFADTDKNKLERFAKLGSIGGLTTLCVNKEKKIAAVGTKIGKIILIHNLCIGHSKWILSFVHWHTLPVLSLSFNAEGSMLYSGGKENVLVFWPVKNTTSRDFLPRIPAPIKFIHALEKSGEILCALEDNSLITISTSRSIDKQFAFFVKQMTDCASKQPELRNVVKTFSNQIVAKSHPGMIQFSKADTAVVTMEFDVCQFSYVAERDPKPHWNILAFDINESGHLCTLEHCQVQALEQAVLKFWIFNESQFDLDISVHGVKFQNSCLEAEIVARSGLEVNEFVVSTDEIRIWTYANGSYRLKHTFARDRLNYLSPNCLCFSVDGSLLLGNYGNFLMTWSCFEKYSASAKIILPSCSREVILGKHHLTAMFLLVSFYLDDNSGKESHVKHASEIRSLRGNDLLWSSQLSLSQLGSVPTLPAFMAFCEETNSVVILLAHMSDIFKPIEFTVVQYSLDVTYSCIKPVMVPSFDTYQQTSSVKTDDHEKLTSFMEGHSLVVVTDTSKLLVLENKEANQPFSLLQTSQLEIQHSYRDATEFRDDKNSGKSSIVNRMKASRSLHKFVTEELYEYPSLLLPSVEDISDQLFSFSIEGSKNVSSFKASTVFCCKTFSIV